MELYCYSHSYAVIDMSMCLLQVDAATAHALEPWVRRGLVTVSC
jgi:hypothetical protein